MKILITELFANEFLTAVCRWKVTPYNVLEICRRFEETYYLHLQDREFVHSFVFQVTLYVRSRNCIVSLL
jgi:hypothetical protein